MNSEYIWLSTSGDVKQIKWHKKLSFEFLFWGGSHIQVVRSVTHCLGESQEEYSRFLVKHGQGQDYWSENWVHSFECRNNWLLSTGNMFQLSENRLDQSNSNCVRCENYFNLNIILPAAETGRKTSLTWVRLLRTVKNCLRSYKCFDHHHLVTTEHPRWAGWIIEIRVGAWIWNEIKKWPKRQIQSAK